MAIRILKNRGNELGKQVRAEVEHWDSGDIRDLLSLIACQNVNRVTCEDAAEALAYLNWRWNRRLHPSRSHEAKGGDRCKADGFEGRA